MKTYPRTACVVSSQHRIFHGIVSTIFMAAMAMTACSSLPKDVTLGPNGFTWVGPDGATITAQGLEDAAKQLLQHLIDLEPQLPGAQDIFDGYNDKLTEVLQGKQGFAPRGPSSSGPSIAP